jgi:hypothetical protein
LILKPALFDTQLLVNPCYQRAAERLTITVRNRVFNVRLVTGRSPVSNGPPPIIVAHNFPPPTNLEFLKYYTDTEVITNN